MVKETFSSRSKRSDKVRSGLPKVERPQLENSAGSLTVQHRCHFSSSIEDTFQPFFVSESIHAKSMGVSNSVMKRSASTITPKPILIRNSSRITSGNLLLSSARSSFNQNHLYIRNSKTGVCRAIQISE